MLVFDEYVNQNQKYFIAIVTPSITFQGINNNKRNNFGVLFNQPNCFSETLLLSNFPKGFMFLKSHNCHKNCKLISLSISTRF